MVMRRRELPFGMSDISIRYQKVMITRMALGRAEKKPFFANKSLGIMRIEKDCCEMG